MRIATLGAVLAAVLALCGAAVAASHDPPALSASEVIARFKASTGETLLVDRRASYPGHYTALALPGSMGNHARYGRFTLYVVGSTNRDEEVADLLADGHTGLLGTPGPSQIYWESGRDLSGGRYWLAKKRYGANVVLWWFGSERRVDRAFRRLHVQLLQKVAV